MTSLRWTDATFWRRRFARDQSMEPPSKDSDIGSETVFGWLEHTNTASFPCFEEAMCWIWCPTASAMAGYLRHCYTGACLGELLDVTCQGYLSVEDILTKASPEELEEAHCDPRALLSAVQGLDKAMEEKSEARCFSGSRRAIHRFLGAMGDVEWLRHDLALFDAPAAVGRHALKVLEAEGADVDEQLGMSKAKWRLFCAEATQDGKAFARALEALARL